MRNAMKQYYICLRN